MTVRPTATALPEQLVEREQWLCWRTEKRDGKSTKVPLVPGTDTYAAATDPGDWGAFETARDAVESTSADGLGFAFTADDPLVGVDLDDCREPQTGKLDETARDIVCRLDSYTEVSPSGTGVHVLVRGKLPDGRNRTGSIECYDRARYFTVTGDALSELPDRIEERSDALASIHEEYVAVDGGSSVDEAPAQSGDSSISLTDDEVLKRARSAANGRKFCRLWNGSTSGYDSHSEADMALCCLLAFWTGGDAAQIDRLFRRSDLLRNKWDGVHYTDGSTYGEKTIERAVTTTAEFYAPPSDKTTADSQSQDSDKSAAESPSRARLLERNELLIERVQTLEAGIKERETKIEALEEQLTNQDGDEPLSPTDEASAESFGTVVDRVMRWLGR